jgi:hypothetical protein
VDDSLFNKQAFFYKSSQNSDINRVELNVPNFVFSGGLYGVNFGFSRCRGDRHRLGRYRRQDSYSAFAGSPGCWRNLPGGFYCEWRK